MFNNLQILATILKKSDLSTNEQTTALDYFKQVSDEELDITIRTFKNSPKIITKFWRILYLKTMLLNLITQTNDLPEKEKNNLVAAISKMNDSEFTIFINALSNAKNTADITEELQKIFTSYKKMNSKIAGLINKLIEK